MAELPLTVLLSRLAAELASLQALAGDMEAAVDDMVERHAGMLDARSIRNLQLLDIVGQTLVALSAVAANAAARAAPDWAIDGQAAVAGVKLAALAQRLAEGAGHAPPAETEGYELFLEG